ncbi:MAG: hypothetical protein Q7S00_03280, partial [bacterium]|nr:hypothetical protein [bacterium]
QAVPHLTHATTLLPEEPTILTHRGELALWQNKTDEALDFFKKALRVLSEKTTEAEEAARVRKRIEQIQTPSLVARLKKQNDTLQSLKAILHLSNGHLTGGANHLLFLSLPASFRIESYNDLGAPLSRIISNGKEMNLSGLNEFPLNMDPKVIPSLLVGLLPLEEEADYSIKKQRDGTVVLEGKRTEIRLTANERPEQFIQRDANGDPLYKINFEKWAWVNPFFIPQKITVHFWKPKQTLKIVYEEIEINPRLSYQLFEPTP